MSEKSITIQEFNSDEITLIKDTICKGASDNELKLFLSITKKTGLDPFTRQIYCVPRWDSKLNRNVYSAQTSVDGLRLIALRSGQYAGQCGPFWCDMDGVWTDVWLKNTPPVAAKVGILRHDFKEPLWAVAKWDAYKQTDKNGNVTKFWAKMPDLMISKCAESLALRKGFPHELSGIYSAEEMAQADIIEEQAFPEPENKPPQGKFMSAGDFVKPEERKPVYMSPKMSEDDSAVTIAGMQKITYGIHFGKRICDVSVGGLKELADEISSTKSAPEDVVLLRNINSHLSAFKVGNKSQESVYQKPGNFSSITEPMRRRLFAILSKSGWSEAELKNFLAGSMGVESSKNINSAQYAEICDILEKKIPISEALMMSVTVTTQPEFKKK